MGGGSGGTNKTAKEVLDEFGQKVYEEIVKNVEAKKYIKELKGSLSQVSTNSETNSTQNPCTFDYAEHTTGAKDNTKPCGKNGKEDIDRFSKERGAECDNRKISGSNGKDFGACAPLRRLSLCNKNMINMVTNNNDSKAKHDLLADVCYAAKFEGESLINYRDQYDATYPGSANTMCTMLARSFADIGDIIRGKDLYRGGGRGKGKEKLDKNLQKIFKEIHNGLPKQNGAQTYYEDKDGGNYFQLREDWWTANRKTVWKAITCSKDLDNSSYFHATCSINGSGSQANHYCRCNGDKPGHDQPNTEPPTFFDYVPQYLRWFEEWAEDFCRKKNKKIKDVKKSCRDKGDDDSERYCSRNGYDCTKTKRAIGKYRMGNQCTKCLFACNPYVDWINNQKEQFDKQVKRYETEISRGGGSGSRSGTRRSSSSNYDEYESKFYKILKDEYGDVNKFLEKLSAEEVCKKITDTEEGTINFKTANSGSTSGDSGTNDINNGTFYRSQYCQPCPHCGVKRRGNEWEKKNTDQCNNIKRYKPKGGATGITIRILKSGDEEKEIKEKLDKFCETQNGNSGTVAGGTSDSSMYEPWKCYKHEDLQEVGEQNDDDDNEYDNEVESGGGLCILQKKNGVNVEKQKTFNDFFYYWVAHMLKDSIYWRTKKIKRCLENNNGNRCRNGCNTKCDCFEKWVKQKKEQEWSPIKEHFYKQPEIPGGCYFTTLEYNLKEEFYKEKSEGGSEEDTQNSLDAQEAEELKRIRQIIESEDENQEEAGASAAGGDGGTTDCAADNAKKTIMDKLLDHELNDASQCKECPPPSPPASVGRSLENTPASSPPAGDSEEESEEEEEEEIIDEVLEEGEEEAEESSITEEKGPPKVEGDPPCDIVKDLFENPKTDFKDACTLKYGKNAPTSWKCVAPSGTNTSETGERAGRQARSTDRVSGKATPSDNYGSICIPPRRRKMYVGPLKKWADEEAAKGSTSLQNRDGAGGEGSEAAGSGSQTEAGSQEADTVTQNGETTSATSQAPDGDPLLAAFVESAAVETFFLWHNYKEQWKLENGGDEVEGPKGGGFGAGRTSTVVGPFVTSHSEMRASSSLHPPAGPHPPTGGSLQPTPPLLPVPPGFPPGAQLLPNGNGERVVLHDAALGGQGAIPGASGDSDDNSPQQQLLSGKIPNDFLRQMFYTIADYRDILVRGGGTGDTKDSSGSSNSDRNIVLEAGGDKASMEKIQEQIDKILEKTNGDSISSSPVTHSSQKQQTPVQQRQTLWSNYAEHIWNGMICALTYKDNSDTEGEKKNEGNNKPIQDKKVKEAFFGKDNNENTPNNPSGKTGTTSGTYETKYKYQTVTLKDENSDTEAKPYSGSSPPSGDDPLNTPKLIDFVKIPTFFRWLHEWGTEFCGMRARLLEKIKYECRNSERGGHEYCGGDGHDCKTSELRHNKMSAQLDCPDCAKECMKYKKWIHKKFEEYQKQQSIYQTEHGILTKVDKSGGDYKHCCDEIKKKKTAIEFLKELKHCKEGQSGGEKNNNIDFDNPLQMFGPLEYCKTCPIYGVKEKRGTYEPIEEKNYLRTNGSVQNDNPTSPTEIQVLVLGRTADVKDKYDDIKNACKNTGLLEDTCVQNWKCQKKNGIHECNLNGAGETVKSSKSVKSEYFEKKISFKILFQSWVIDFIEYYNKSKERITRCTNDANSCKQGCNNKCDYVKKWLERKKQEWKTIKKYYEDNFPDEDERIPSRINSFFEQTPFNTYADEAKKVVKCKNEKDKLLGCTGENLEHGKKEKCKDDFITNLIEKLEKKIEECKSQHSETQEKCVDSPPLPDEEEDPENAEENTVTHPQFCEKVLPPKVDDQTNGDCDEPNEEEKDKGDEEGGASSTGGEKGDATAPTEPPEEPAAGIDDQTKRGPDQAKGESKDKDQKETKVNPPADGDKKKAEPPIKLLDDPLVIPALSSSTLMWSIGISFAALTYWLLKKKSKPSVDLLSVLEIPQNDYGIPTLKSSNRYIPYASGKYRGKRYVYIEGDSGTDSGYTDHYSDITSSSESEYEELDINDIYVPGSPKYKTLIEVVLEPSKRETNSGDTIPYSGNTIPNSDNTIPNSGNTIPNSDNTIPTSDIQNNIPNDNTPGNKFTDEEWNQLKDEFISNMLQNTQPNDVPNDYTSGTTPTNTNNTTMSSHNVDNNTHPTPSRDTLDQKPFIMSIHDRNLLSGEEYSYDMANIVDSPYSGVYSTSGNLYSYSGENSPYSGIDLINDALSGDHDIYDEILKRKENELFGTNHPKNTSNNSVAKNTNSDPIHNQLDLFHKWLDRHRNVCEKWDTNNKKVDILNQLKEEWNKENNNNSGKTYNSDNKPSHNHVLNSDVSIQIDMNNPKTKNEFKNMDTTPNKSTMDTILHDLEKYNEPYYYDFYKDDIYYDVNDDDKTSVDHINMDYNKMDNNNSDVPTKVQIEMNIVNNKKEIFEEEYPMSDIWNI
ncbi:erythrocyte membrane protein 1, PfEMP1, putative [Plasmodium reichenowi]|uniref:Erythrocyte membrane protein 1, PfEMP1, putative n=1 Tax=Plasmodium reichenowi TaxID=5854 RepID=A0A2P9D5Q8_PLARE|nr:erythrocyte membrane protein 1, PfEMP1, putative [Plasmodium reichenowi]